MRDADAVSAMVQQAAERLGGLDVLVNAAGLWQPGIPGYVSVDEISFLLDTNVKATILTNQAAYAVMKDQDPKGGKIINFGSSEAVMGSPISAVYAATKGAVQAWTRSAASAWAADNVTVNALAPAVQTAGADRLRDFLGPAAGALIDQQMQMMIPLGGALGDPARDLGPDAGLSRRSRFRIHHRTTAGGRRRPDDGRRIGSGNASYYKTDRLVS